MKVLHLSGADVWGGNENQLAHFIQNSQLPEIENQVFCFENTPIHRFVQKQGIGVCGVPKSGSFSIRTSRALADYVKSQKIDVVHIHTSNFLSTYMMADLLFKIPAKAVFSKKGISDASTWLSRLKYNYKGVAAYICVSEAVRKSFQPGLNSIRKKLVSVIYDGIPVSIGNNANEKPVKKESSVKIIGSVANHTDAKDLPTLIRSIGYLVHQLGRTDVELHQYGLESGLTPQLRQMVSDLKLENHVKFMGYREEIASAFDSFDISLISSQREGGPVFLLESFKFRIPVVTTSVGIVPELLEADHHAIIAETGDYEALARGVQYLLNNPQKAGNMATAARSLLERKLTIEHTISQTLDLYKGLF
ncbi:glycosyltransferase family 4 protein [Robertkochia aurantiaca]|uniref:glycosyltransferase family 4 protein n=1 Tax=Robertkochia aurantiaca TaxID=2873700 RepID=UPI001CCF611F|nr:glycosyltransferase family 4 protein [Robertkochia sp. 3YJGBD-33]